MTVLSWRLKISFNPIALLFLFQIRLIIAVQLVVVSTFILICKCTDLYWKEQKIVEKGESNSISKSSVSSCFLFESKIYRMAVCLFSFCT